MMRKFFNITLFLELQCSASPPRIRQIWEYCNKNLPTQSSVIVSVLWKQAASLCLCAASSAYIMSSFIQVWLSEVHILCFCLSGPHTYLPHFFSCTFTIPSRFPQDSSKQTIQPSAAQAYALKSQPYILHKSLMEKHKRTVRAASMYWLMYSKHVCACIKVCKYQARINSMCICVGA